MSENCKTRSKASKVMALVLSFVLVICASVAGTLAWLSAETSEVKNTFTSAELFENPTSDFTLWENKAVDPDEDGEYELNGEKVQSNTYDILPGVDIPKNPTVDVDNLEEHAYLYIKVTGIPMATGLTATVDSANWTVLDDTEYPGVYVYSGSEANGNNVIEATDNNMASFEATILTGNQIVVANDYNGTDDDIELNFKAYMVQATGNGANAAEAWANTFGETTGDAPANP